MRYLERARSKWYRGVRALRHREAEQSLGTVVVNIDYNYRVECFVGERLKVTTRPIAMGTRSFTLEHAIIKPDGRTAIDGQCTSVIMDLGEAFDYPRPGVPRGTFAESAAEPLPSGTGGSRTAGCGTPS